jgi:predicted transcriptional regulator of viral defense system
MDRPQAAKTLARWQQQGWLTRVGRGLYAPIPLDAITMEQVLTDPWILVPARFAPSYIGGWTAAEHWHMTEQLFRSIFVFTARPIRARELVIQGVSFTLRRIKQTAIFGTRTLWRGHTRVAISDQHRTIVDLLANPATGGGIRHVESCLKHYLADRESDRQILIRYAETLGNGAVFKRLGFLVSRWCDHDPLVEACRLRLTQGNARLDPAQPCRRLMKTWRLWVPKSWVKGTPSRR